MEHMNLLGSDDVLRGGHAASAGGEAMKRAADTFDHSTMLFTQRLEDLVLRFERAAELISGGSGPAEEVVRRATDLADAYEENAAVAHDGLAVGPKVHALREALRRLRESSG